MTEQEAIYGLIEATRKKKIDAFDYMRIIYDMAEKTLRASGHKTKEEAMIFTLERTIKDIHKLEVEFLKKYPDK